MNPSSGDDVIMNNLDDDLTPDDPDNSKTSDRTTDKNVDDIHKMLPRVVIEPDLLRVMGHLPKQS